MRQATASFDPRPLTDPVDKAAARAFARQLRANGGGRSGQQIIGIVMIVVIAVMFLSVGSTVFVGFISAATSMGGGLGGLFAIVPIIMVLVFVGALVAAIAHLVRGTGAIRTFRLANFARANAMTYDPGMAAPELPGMIFQVGSSRTSSDLVRGDQPRFVEFGNYRYTTGSGKEQTTHRWGYVAIKLDVPLPNIVLDATSNNALFGSNLPASFSRDQRLSLEGDFDKHFALYCPEGYERDALYLFTPDIMARFVDHAAALDVEIVDDWLFLYAQRDLSTLDPATWAWLFATVGAILDKMAQWARWRDDHAVRDAAAPAAAVPAAGTASTPDHPFAAPAMLTPPPPIVAPRGRRLRRRVPVVTFVIAGIFLVVWASMFFRIM
ncbi:hypothetical protein [Microbacterium terrisoli]|uniref:hypothetical protein n=1 Tax=Microbacterium terrisoli TaxID=3242192 RepID=UPI00280521A3|nr:hypothetical protein [Microbacterium protaetiae]